MYTSALIHVGIGKPCFRSIAQSVVRAAGHHRGNKVQEQQEEQQQKEQQDTDSKTEPYTRRQGPRAQLRTHDTFTHDTDTEHDFPVCR